MSNLNQHGGGGEPLPLFRKEALEAERSAWLGSPLVAQPLQVRLFAVAGLAVVAALSVLIGTETYTDRVKVPGVVTSSAGTIHVTAPSGGRIERLAATEGQRVEKGQLLYLIGTDSISETGATQEEIGKLLLSQRSALSEERERQTAIAALKRAALTTRIADLQAETAQIDRQVDIAAQFVGKMDEAVRVYSELAVQRLVSNRDLLERQQIQISQRSQLEALRRERIVREASLHDCAAELGRLPDETESKLGELRRSVAEVDRQLADVESKRLVKVVASGQGTVTGIVGRPGAVLRPGEPLLTILPGDGTLEVQLFADSHAIGFIRPGGRLLLRYEAFPYQKFGQHGATVAAISYVPLGADEIDKGVPITRQSETRAALFRITTRPDEDGILAYGTMQPLRVGMQLEATIFLDRRPLWQWILHPLFSIGGVRGSAPPNPGAPAENRS